VVVCLVRQKLQVLEECPAAAKHAVRRGMTLAEARAICPGLVSVDHDPAGDDRAITALGRWMTRFTPVVATGWAEEGLPPPPHPPRLLLLDITGCDRVFGGVRVIVQRVASSLEKWRVPASVAVAPTPGAAWAFAVTSPGRVIEPADLPPAAALLPVDTLRLDDDTVDTLVRLGLNKVGQLLKLPRGTFEARFGRGLGLRLDQLLGNIPEPLVPLSYDVPIEAAMEFESPIDSLETMWLVLAELVNRVTADLQRRGHGARVVELLFKPEKSSGRSPVRGAVQLSTPTRNVEVLLRLLKSAAERITQLFFSGGPQGRVERRSTFTTRPFGPPLKKRFRILHGDGFVFARLAVPVHERMSVEQIPLLDDVAFISRYDLDRLIEQLRVRLGDVAVVRPVIVESHLPEQAWRPTPTDTSAEHPPIGPRPLRLLPTPPEIRVIAEPDGNEGRPRQFSHAGQTHRLTEAIGPERLAGQWWRGHHKTRDYYDVTDDTGRRFWVFRVIRITGEETFSTRWFLQGEFY
jgi:protein ImuB